MPMALIEVKVKPGAGASLLTQDPGTGAWTAHVKAPPVDGKANAELIRLVAGHFGCARSAVTIRSGASARIKRLRIDLP